MNKTLKIILSVIVLGIIVVLVAVFYEPAQKGMIKIGVLVPLTGSVAEYGKNAESGIELAVEEINNNGGIGGRKIELFVEDTKCDPKETVTSFNKLVDMNNIDVLLGTVCSGEVLAIAPLLNEKKIPIISACASSPEITNTGDYIFRVYPSDDYDAGAAAKLIINKFKKTKASVLYVNNDYGTALMKSFKSQFTTLGGEVLNSEGYLQDSKDFRTQLLKIKEVNPEVVYFISYPIDGGIAVKQVKEMGINALFLGTSGLKANDFISNGGSATEDFILTVPQEPSSYKGNNFIMNYQKRFNTKPGICSDRGYDSVYVLKEAYANSTEAIKNNLYKLKNFIGVIGNIEFDKNGDLTNINYNLLKIKNGQFVPYEE